VLLSIVEALIALPKIGEQINALLSKLLAWYISRLNNQNKEAITDALHFNLKAESKEDRIKAAKMWQDALSNPVAK